MTKEIPGTLDRVQADIVVYMVTVDDILDRRWSDEEGVLRPPDQRYGERLEAAYADANGLAIAHGASSVVWLLPPATGSWSSGSELKQRDRLEAQAAVIRRVVAADDSASVIDLDAWFTGSGKAADRSFRPDGVHMTEGSAAELATAYLGPALVQLAIGAAP